MKITDMSQSYANNTRLKARLNIELSLSNGHVFKEGTVSELLIELDDGVYHFEAENEACKVYKHEIDFLFGRE